MAKGKAKAKARKSRHEARESRPFEMKEPSMEDVVNDHAGMAARAAMSKHPMMKKMHRDMKSALMSVVRGRGPGARGRRGGFFE